MRTLLTAIAIFMTCSAALAEGPREPFATGHSANQVVPGLGMIHPMHQYAAPYYMYSPREFATLSSPTYTHIWIPAYRLPPYQQSAYDYWHRMAYGPFLRATGYPVP
jgi:hypothetical protein